MSSYDQNLLDEAPKATRAQLQQGYNVDLLEAPPRRTPSQRHPPAENDSGSAAKPKHSFWRTRKGILTILVLVLVVIGAVVGGAVGGTLKKSSNNSVAKTGSTSTPSPNSQTQAAGSQTTGSQGIAGGTSLPAGLGGNTSARPSTTPIA